MMETLKRSFSDALLEVDIMSHHHGTWPLEDNDCSPRKLYKKGPQEDNVQIQIQVPNLRKRRIESWCESSDDEEADDKDDLFDTSLRKRAKVHEMEELDNVFDEKLSLDPSPSTSKALVLQRPAVAKEIKTPRYESIYLTVEDVTHAAHRDGKDGRDDQHPSLFGPFSIPPDSGQLIKYDGTVKPYSIEEVDDRKESQDASLMEIIEFLD